jgi:hypothetical protein
MSAAPRALILVSFLFASAVCAHSQTDIDDQIATEQAAITALQTELAPKVQPLLIPNTGVRLWVSKTVLPLVANFFNSLSAAQRHAQYDATSTSGQLVNSNGGGLGCGWYAALDGNNAHADVQLQNLAATMNSNGTVDISVGFQFSFTAKIDGHVNGPAGPCSLWNPWPSCNCQIGGGAGTSVGTSGQQGGTLSGSIAPRSDPTSWLVYDVSLTAPSSIPITISVGLGGIGAVGIPITITLPNGILSTGSVPSVFGGMGSLNIPNILAKQYTFAVQPNPVTFDNTGYSATANVQIAWK